MSVEQDQSGTGSAPGRGAEKPARAVPTAALAGAVVLIGLVAFALYRRNVASPPAAAPPPAATAPAGDAAPQDGTQIVATPPRRLSPEASILAERYRCVCGCNDTLSVCTCNKPSGSDEMKEFLQGQVDAKRSPEEVDRAMSDKYGEVCLLSHPAPPQTEPSHAGVQNRPALKPSAAPER